jgi:hypothetical protein
MGLHVGHETMLRRTPIFIVASPRPRVGKTLLARMLVEYLCVQWRQVAAFDVNPDDFALLERLPAYTAAASLYDTRGEMALFDQLVTPDGVPKVVDLGHGQFDRFFAVLQAINFGAEVRRKAIVPMVLFLAEPDQRARQGYAMLSDRFPDLPIIAVFNEMVPMMERFRDEFPEAPRGGAPLDIPAISPVVRGLVDRPSFSFISYITGAPDPTAELYQWTRRMFLLLREIEVRLLLGELSQPQLRHSA